MMLISKMVRQMQGYVRTRQVAVRQRSHERDILGAPVQAIVLQPCAAPRDDRLHIARLLHQHECACMCRKHHVSCRARMHDNNFSR